MTVKSVIKKVLPQKALLMVREMAARLRMSPVMNLSWGDGQLAAFDDGLLHIRITNRCNAKCRYCGIQAWPEDVQKMSMYPKKILYDLAAPVYERIKMLLLTGGDPLIVAESKNYCKFISERYLQVTLMLETNGIAFTREWQEFAIKNLVKVHISLNASTRALYEKGCWTGYTTKYAATSLTIWHSSVSITLRCSRRMFPW
jgi:sulfatase maturation enzyme AslB (radical SAM superfamily)